MNTKKIVTGVGTFILFVAAVIAGRASTKFSQTAAYFKTSGVAQTCTLLKSVAGSFFSTAGTNSAQIRTSAGGSRQIYSENTCTTVAYFKP